MKDALDRLRQTLEDDGQYETKAAYEMTPHPDTLQMDILVRVTPGPRARIGAITLQNQTQFHDEELRSLLKLKEGDCLGEWPQPRPVLGDRAAKAPLLPCAVAAGGTKRGHCI